jgi:hypothetical protein
MTVETRYMRSDTQTINGLLAYILGTSQSSTLLYSAGGSAGKVTVYWACDVAVRHADGSETLLEAKIGQVYRSTVSSGVQSKTWGCPLTALVSTDAVVVRVYDKYGTGSWNLRATFITEQLSSATQLDAATWTFYYYTSRDYDVNMGTTGAFYWGIETFGGITYNSRIENFTWSIPSVAVEFHGDGLTFWS